MNASPTRLEPATVPTMYFVGVTTTKSSIMKIFPKWSDILGIGARLVGYMVGCTPTEMAFGMPVRVVFKRLTDAITLPVWGL